MRRNSATAAAASFFYFFSFFSLRKRANPQFPMRAPRPGGRHGAGRHACQLYAAAVAKFSLFTPARQRM